MTRTIAAALVGLGLLTLPGSTRPTHAQEAVSNDPLATLEAAVTAAPDDLKPANAYRAAAIGAKQFDRSIAFFEKVTTEHPSAANAHLNHGFAYVDKIPVAGSITAVILANNALRAFTKSLEVRRTWLALYTRGNSYLFWPRIFGRTPNGVADLEEALKLQRADATRHIYYARVYTSLGDGYWKLDRFDEAQATWKEGAEFYPDYAALKARLSASPDALAGVIDKAYDPLIRVDTDLSEMWEK